MGRIPLRCSARRHCMPLIDLRLFLLLLLSAWIVGKSHAETIPASSGWCPSWGCTQVNPLPSVLAVCQYDSTLPSWPAGNTYACINVNQGATSGSYTVRACSISNPASCSFTNRTAQFLSRCPSTGGWTLQGTSCTRPDCAPGQTRDAVTGQCQAVCPDAGTPATGVGLIKASANHAPEVRTACTDGCVTIPIADCPTHARWVNGVRQIYCTGYYSYTGGNRGDCTAGPSGDVLTEAPPNSCGPGQVGGTVNGVFRCVNSGTGELAAPPQAPTSTTTTGTTSNSDGSTTTTKEEVDATTGIRTVTTTVTQPNGSQTTTVTSNRDPLADLEKQKTECEKNPNLVQCRELGEAPAPEALSELNIPIAFNPVAIPADATCPAPITFTVAGQPWEIEYDGICIYAAGLRPVVLAFAYLGAMLIIVGGIRQNG